MCCGCLLLAAKVQSWHSECYLVALKGTLLLIQLVYYNSARQRVQKQNRQS